MGNTESSYEAKDTVNFFLNGKAYTVSTDNDKVGPESLLIDYIREDAGLTGTKYMCREGGCGACVVSIKAKDPVTGEEKVRAVNSCLIPLFCCDGWDISTVESLGNRRDGYSQLQKTLVHFGGTQCGFCSPGMLMNMHSLLKSNDALTAKDIEDNFDGNICRCTGYRPILDAFKTFTGDAPQELLKKCTDIEDCSSCPMKLRGEGETDSGEGHCTISPLYINTVAGQVWVKATSLDTIFHAIEKFRSESLKYRIVSGNTGTGVFKNDGPYQAYLDVTSVPELKESSITQNSVVIGAGCTLSAYITSLKQASTTNGFQYLSRISRHIQRVANVPVRNVGTIAGNLMLKHTHNEFPSDIFLTSETVDADLTIATAPSELVRISPAQFLHMDMNGKIILSINFKPYSEGYSYRSFKITRRFQNAHAYVNAGFMMKIDKANNYTVMEKPRIVFGGINPSFVHASATENILTGKSLKDKDTIRLASDSLKREIVPNINPPDGSPEFRRNLAISLLYKYILGVMGPDAKAEFRTGGKNIKRDTKSAQQTFETDKEFFPVGQPVLKLESVAQCSGEAEYINDIHPQHGECFGAFVTSTVGNAELHGIDASEALALRGVVAFITAKDIPGKNNYMTLYSQPEEIFATHTIKHSGQPVGMIVAENKEIAFRAAKLVRIHYANIRPPVLSIDEGIEKAKAEGTYEKLIAKVAKSVDYEDGANTATHIIQGEFSMGSQYHFQMETHICICIPKEDGMDVYSATQWMDHVQSAIASTLAISNNEVNISIRRLGGAFGSKISRGAQTACACALAAHVTDKPVRVALDLQTNMEMVGKRPPYLMKYEVSVDENGKISSLKGQLYCDTGIETNEETADVGLYAFQSMYRAIGWEVATANVLTNTPANTWCRAPGTTPAIAMIENIMEHIAFVVQKDPIEVRLANILLNGHKIMKPLSANTFVGENLIPAMLKELETSGSIKSRLEFIKKFNLKTNNRWRKRGMAVVPLRYPLEYGSARYPVYIAIYKNDGSVVVSHGGIESGQGLNTKVAQTVAYAFDIPLDMIVVKPSNNLVSANADTTGASITSELCCHAALVACQKLKDRMKPIKDSMKEYSWRELITLCNKANIDLTASHVPIPSSELKSYDIWVVNLTEVEIDCLTGEYRIVRIDIIEDAGKSLNPEIDVGQVEGALIMGLGLWTMEKLVYNKQSGRLLTRGTWEYKPPLVKDIPDDLRVTLLRNAPNPYGVLRSKATGEPPLCSSVSVLFALKNAIYAARQDAGRSEWFQLDGPVTVEDIRQLCLSDPSQFDV